MVLSPEEVADLEQARLCGSAGRALADDDRGITMSTVIDHPEDFPTLLHAASARLGRLPRRSMDGSADRSLDGRFDHHFLDLGGYRRTSMDRTPLSRTFADYTDVRGPLIVAVGQEVPTSNFGSPTTKPAQKEAFHPLGPRVVADQSGRSFERPYPLRRIGVGSTRSLLRSPRAGSHRGPSPWPSVHPPQESLLMSMQENDLSERVQGLETAQAVQSAVQAGAQATQAAVQAGAATTNAAAHAGVVAMVAAGSVSLIAGLFLGMAIRATK
jgi:hypothetical protein